MAEIPLNRIKGNCKLFALVDDHRYEWAMQYYWQPSNFRGAIYATRSPYINGKKQSSIYMHREIMGVTDPLILVDHWDRVSLNNQEYNLRIATRSQNSMNRERNSTYRSSIYKGVQWIKALNKWYAKITIDGKVIPLGYYSFEVDAAIARNLAEIKYFGEWACLNTIIDSQTHQTRLF